MAPSLAPAGVLTLDALRAMPAGDITDAVMGRPWSWRTPGWRGARPTVLAIDPGRATGWAVIHASLYVGGVRDWSPSWWVDRLARTAADVVMVEDSFLGKDPRAFQRLSWMVGAISVLAELGGHHVVRVSPPTWQSAMLGPSQGRAEGKARSLAIAQRRVDPRIRSDHAADAALLALWARGV